MRAQKRNSTEKDKKIPDHIKQKRAAGTEQTTNKKTLKTGKKKRKNPWKIFMSFLALCAAITVSVLAILFFMRYDGLMNSIISTDDANAVSDLQKDPFAVMLLGEGTNGQDGEGATDSITLVVLNPTAHLARIISIPRDSYLPRGSACESAGYYDKIANSGGSIPCLQTTLEAVFDVNINYYVSINFISFVKIVDAIGGVEMDVPDLREGFANWQGGGRDLALKKNGLQWCEHDSLRQPYNICFTEFGKQVVDGEHALALARTRHYDSDFARSRRQSELIRAIANKVLANFNVFLINDLLAAAEGNIKTNIPQTQFFDFARLGQKLMSSKSGFAVQSLQLDGESGTFQGDIYRASYNRVSLFSLENIRLKIAQTFSPEDFPPINIDAFYFDPGNAAQNEFASKYKNYDDRGFLMSHMHVQDSDYVKKYNTKHPYVPKAIETTGEDE